MTQSGIEQQLELQQYKAVPTEHNNSAIRSIFHAIFGVKNLDDIWADSNIMQHMKQWDSELQNIGTASIAKKAYLRRIQESNPLESLQWDDLYAQYSQPYLVPATEDDISEDGTNLELVYKITDEVQQNIADQIATNPVCIQAYINLVLGNSYRLMREDIDLIAHLFSIRIYLHQGIDITTYNETSNDTEAVHLVLTRNKFVERMVPHTFLKNEKQFIQSLLEWRETRHNASVDVHNKTHYTLIDGSEIESSIANMLAIVEPLIVSIKAGDIATAKHYLAQLYTEHSQCFDMLFQKYKEAMTTDDKRAYATAFVLLYPEKRESYPPLLHHLRDIDPTEAGNHIGNMQMIPGYPSEDMNIHMDVILNRYITEPYNAQKKEREFFYFVLEHAPRKLVINIAEYYFSRYFDESNFSQEEYQSDLTAMLDWIEKAPEQDRKERVKQWYYALIHNLSLSLYQHVTDNLIQTEKKLLILAKKYSFHPMAIIAHAVICFNTGKMQHFIKEFDSYPEKSPTVVAIVNYFRGCLSQVQATQLEYFIEAAKCQQYIGNFMKLHLAYYWVISSSDTTVLEKGCKIFEDCLNNKSLNIVEFFDAYWAGLVILIKKDKAQQILQLITKNSPGKNISSYQTAQNNYWKKNTWQEKKRREELFSVINFDNLLEEPKIERVISKSENLLEKLCDEVYEHKGIKYVLSSHKGKHTSQAVYITDKIKSNPRYLLERWGANREATFNLNFAPKDKYNNTLKEVINIITETTNIEFDKNYYVRFNEIVGWDTGSSNTAGEETDIIELYSSSGIFHIRPKSNSQLKANVEIIVYPIKSSSQYGVSRSSALFKLPRKVEHDKASANALTI